METVHVDDEGTIVYIDVNDAGISLNAALALFTTRTVTIKRPTTAALIVITAVDTEVDTDDSITKLKLLTGTDVAVALTGTGGFKVPSTDVGTWIAEVLLADALGSWRSDPINLFNCQRNLV